MFCHAMELQINEVQDSQKHSLLARVIEGTKDADKITKALRNINSLCDVFQIDTQLHIEGRLEDTDVMVNEILRSLNSSSIDRLRTQMTSYKTRRSSYGDPSGCMAGTRVKILEELEAWALDDLSSKVYWLVGMAGTGKSTISQTFCEILDHKNILGASFFCSRASENTSDARLIIPSIAHSLAGASPSIKYEVVKAIVEDPALAESTYIDINDQFNKLVVRPIQTSIDRDVKIYKVVVIDAVDECIDLRVAASLIRIIVKSCSSGVPLKVFIASRDETPIRNAFHSIPEAERPDAFYLHEVEKEVVRDDIEKYVRHSLTAILERNADDSVAWPSQAELSSLLDRCGTLFVYAATAIRYIDDEDGNHQYRLSTMTGPRIESGSRLQTAQIDNLYGHILERACDPNSNEPGEVMSMRQTLATIIFSRIPLSIQAIGTLLAKDVSASLSPVRSLIHVPNHGTTTTVTAFHTSFPDFVTDPTRCSRERCPTFRPLVRSECHAMLAHKCLELMNRSLRYNICDVVEELTVSCKEATNLENDMSKISEALRYACVYWASHFALQAADVPVIAALRTFLYNHLLHWIECLSVLGELPKGLTSLVSAATALSHFRTTDSECHDLWLLVEDARRFLHMNFECIQRNTFEIYQSALVWIPADALILKIYAPDTRRQALVLGLPDSWGLTELVIRNNNSATENMPVAFSQNSDRVASGSAEGMVQIWDALTGKVQASLLGHRAAVTSVAFSQDGSRLISGSYDETIRIWDAMTGEVQAQLIGHTNAVSSVAFSQDGSRIVSGSYDEKIRIWDARTGEQEAELTGHTHTVTCVAFSQDGSRVVSGSYDKTIRIWDTATGEVQAQLTGHTEGVTSVSFSRDGGLVVSGSDDRTARVWNVTTREAQADFVGHTAGVTSVAFSPDGSRVVTGSEDSTIRIWKTLTGEVQAELAGHPAGVSSLALSQDGNRVVSGSYDNTIRIWNATQGQVGAEHKGHACTVTSVAFSEDGNLVVSGSDDHTARIWNVRTGAVKAEFVGHTAGVTSVAFSPDGSRVVSGSEDETIWIWNVMTGEAEAELKGHTYTVTSVAFSQDGTRVVSGSYDETIRIWDATTGQGQVELTGHTEGVTSVAFSHDGSQVASGSDDCTARIWNATTGEVLAELMGHTSAVTSIAFSQDGSRLISGSYDEKIRIWNTTSGALQAELTGHASVVASIASSQTGGPLNSGSDDQRVADETSPRMTSSIKLPDSDSSQLCRQGEGPPVTQRASKAPNLSISDDSQWIVGVHRDCWIPSEYRHPYSLAFSPQRVCFGYTSGRVVILDMGSPV
ncbi:quinon protein alcohol dehydrogenase-like superfamily [Mycena olivaceomarginata]|nr:quinon protein alcohol dehydrogenase-like superfamily [Mycena olivaceomarginata]